MQELFLHKILFRNNSPKQLKHLLSEKNFNKTGVCLRSSYSSFKIERTHTKFGDLTFIKCFYQLIKLDLIF
jgi:hypothetical protein